MPIIMDSDRERESWLVIQKEISVANSFSEIPTIHVEIYLRNFKEKAINYPKIL